MPSTKKTKKQILDLSGITQLRSKKGYTQFDISVITGIKEKRIREIEKGTVDPSMMEIISITKSLGLDLKISIAKSQKFHEPDFLIQKV